MALLVLGLVVFLGGHVFTTVRGRRAELIARLGEGPYKGLYSLVSLAGLVLIVLGWQAAPFVPVWDPPVFARHIAIPLVWVAFVLVVAAYLPTVIRERLKHPMLAGVKIWAFAHLIANGDLASMILFGAFLAYAVFDRIAVKRRRERVEGARIRPGLWRNDAIALAVGTVLFLVFGIWLHPALIGVEAIPI